jgi:hypothetical protein
LFTDTNIKYKELIHTVYLILKIFTRRHKNTNIRLLTRER